MIAMKKTYLVMGFMALFTIFMTYDAITFSSGSPVGRNGSPISNNQTCARSGCHSGGPARSSEFVTIQTDIPSSGFDANTVYKIDISANDGGRNLNRIGFQASIESAAGHEGFIGVAEPNRTSKSSSFLTHTTNGISASNGANSWTFDWDSRNAPSSSKLYVAVNFANGNGTSSGDVIVTQTMDLNQGGTVSRAEQEVLTLSLYPNPAQDFLTVASNLTEIEGYHVYDVSGKEMTGIAEAKRHNAHHLTLDISALPAGQYYLRSAAGAGAAFQKR